MFEFTEEQQMVQRLVRRWCEDKLVPKIDVLERGELLPYDLMRDLAQSFGLVDNARSWIERQRAKAAAPGEPPRGEESTRDPALMAIVTMELSRWSPGFTLALGATVGLAGGALAARGTLAQKERWAVPLLGFEKIGAWAVTEPGAGSDAFGSMKTFARRDGDEFVLRGQKTFITNAPTADILVVYAKLEGDGPPTSWPVHAFVIERGAPGLETGPPMRKMGMHASPTGEIFLSEVRVPRSHLLGEDEHRPARDQVRDTFHSERTGILPMALGIVERCLDEAVEWANTRVTWGKRIGEHQLVQDMLARMFMHRQNLRNLLFQELWASRKGRRLTAAEASVCKLYSARAACEVADDAVQILGGNGYMTEFRVEQMARDARLLRIGGGTDEIQIVTIARSLLRDPA